MTVRFDEYFRRSRHDLLILLVHAPRCLCKSRIAWSSSPFRQVIDGGPSTWRFAVGLLHVFTSILHCSSCMSMFCEEQELLGSRVRDPWLTCPSNSYCNRTTGTWSITVRIFHLQEWDKCLQVQKVRDSAFLLPRVIFSFGFNLRTSAYWTRLLQSVHLDVCWWYDGWSATV